MFRLIIIQHEQTEYAYNSYGTKLCSLNTYYYTYELEIIRTNKMMSISYEPYIRNDITDKISNIVMYENGICDFSYNYCDFRDVPFEIHTR